MRARLYRFSSQYREMYVGGYVWEAFLVYDDLLVAIPRDDSKDSRFYHGERFRERLLDSEERSSLLESLRRNPDMWEITELDGGS